MELILPEELYEILRSGFLAKLKTPVYSRVILPLQALLEGEFFNEYIKRGEKILSSSRLQDLSKRFVLVGNVLMLSEGGVGAKTLYSLRNGKSLQD
jgi:ribonuclease P/MRP protein subunit RPP40